MEYTIDMLHSVIILLVPYPKLMSYFTHELLQGAVQ